MVFNNMENLEKLKITLEKQGKLRKKDNEFVSKVMEQKIIES